VALNGAPPGGRVNNEGDNRVRQIDKINRYFFAIIEGAYYFPQRRSTLQDTHGTG
jgi:hypothetical protein